MKKFLPFLVVALLVPNLVLAGELDLLVAELVAKGIIDPGRAQEILTLTEEEMRKELAKGEVTTLPKWIQKMGIKGDFRLRSQWEKMKEDSLARLRARIRFRLAGEADITNSTKFGFGLASGGVDPRSTNQTLENSFETKTIMLDYAYFQHVLPKYVTVLGGKFYNNLSIWSPSDYMWDTDITLEGLAILGKTKRFFLNSGIYILDEKGKVKSIFKDNPWVWHFQPGINLTEENRYELSGAVSYYYFNKTKDLAFDHAKWSNSSYTVGSNQYLKYGYNNLAVAFSAGVFEKIFPYIGVTAEYNRNLEVNVDNAGQALGVVVGYKKLSNKGQWMFRYQYRKLEKDSWLDFLPDADTFSGRTGVKGNKFTFQYAFTPNVTLGVNYYINENLAGTIQTENICQIDVQFKF